MGFKGDFADTGTAKFTPTLKRVQTQEREPPSGPAENSLLLLGLNISQALIPFLLQSSTSQTIGKVTTSL